MKKLTVISETDLGLYVWQLPDGKYLADSEGNIMNIVSRRDDIQAQAKICEAAKYWGFPDGRPFFMEGARRVSSEERSEQLDRQSRGLIPDPYDIGNYKEEVAWKNKNMK